MFVRPVAETLELQWGHDLAVMESTYCYMSNYYVDPLQWGHDLAVMERTL